MEYLAGKILEALKSRLSKKDVQKFMFGINEDKVGQVELNNGLIVVNPATTDIKAITTGITDEYTHNIEIILGKSSRLESNKKADTEGGKAYLTRVMEGTDENNNLLTNTVMFAIREQYRKFGIQQLNCNINYQDKRFNHEGSVSAVLTLSNIKHQVQYIL